MNRRAGIDPACSTANGCSLANNTLACSDGNPCTQNDACSFGSCQGEPNACGHTEQGCNGTLFCDLGGAPYQCKIKPGSVVSCSSANNTVCVQNQCNTSTGPCAMKSINRGGACGHAEP